MNHDLVEIPVTFKLLVPKGIDMQVLKDYLGMSLDEVANDLLEGVFDEAGNPDMTLTRETLDADDYILFDYEI